jgi:hypothetical protein
MDTPALPVKRDREEPAAAAATVAAAAEPKDTAGASSAALFLAPDSVRVAALAVLLAFWTD